MNAADALETCVVEKINSRDETSATEVYRGRFGEEPGTKGAKVFARVNAPVHMAAANTQHWPYLTGL